jgi:hypothetical protein
MKRNKGLHINWIVGLVLGLLVGVFIGSGAREVIKTITAVSKVEEYKKVQTQRMGEVVEIVWDTDADTYGLVQWGYEMDNLDQIEMAKKGWVKEKAHQVLITADSDRQVYFKIYSDIDLPGGSKQQVVDIDSKQLVELKVLPTMKGGKGK